MSFFAGRFNDGKRVFSLNAQAGGDVSIHYNPNTNSIFHSDMPYVYTTYAETVYLNHVGLGYFTSGISAQLANVLSNDPAAVVLAFLVYVYNGVEYRKQLHGRHETMSLSITGGRAGTDNYMNSSIAAGNFADICLEYGTFTYTGTVDIREDICHRGTGGLVSKWHRAYNAWDDVTATALHLNAMGASASTSKNLNWRDESRFWNPLNNWNGYGDIRIPYEQRNVVDPHIIHPIGPRGQGHNAVFVRTVGGSLLNYTNVALPDNYVTPVFRDLGKPLNYVRSTEDADIDVVQMRGDVTRYADVGLASYTWTTWDITPVRIEYKVLNLRWDPVYGYSATNMFTGNDTLVSRNHFIIKGVDLRNTGTEMFLASALGGVNVYGNAFYATNAYLNGIGDYPDNGSQALIGATPQGNTATIPPSSNGSSSWDVPRATLSTYVFPKNSSVIIDTRSNMVALNGREVWSPNIRPLMLFNGAQANNIILGQNTNLINVGYGGYAILNSVGIGLPPEGTSTVIMSLEYMSVGALCPADYIYSAGDPAALYWNPQGLRIGREDYSVLDGVNHQVLVLPPGVFVPFHARRVNSFSDGVQAQKPRGNVVYFLRKNPTNGGLEFWVRCLSTLGWVIATKFRINVQRLT